MQIASGYDFEPLDDGNVLVQFFDDSGVIVNTQVLTPEAMDQLPLVAAAAAVCQREGPEAAADFMRKFAERGF